MSDKVSKKRLDVYIYERGLAESREKARILIMEGKVYVNGQKEDKPGTMIREDVKVECRGETLKYVSRGGLKLEKAAISFGIDFDNKFCADIGASTGGFTDYMLKNGARTVYAIDSGTNQLDYRLRTNAKVHTLENTNARYLTIDMIEDAPLDIVTIDVSFISLKKIIPVAISLLKDGGEIVMLIKPQFEAGKEKVGKNGVIKDEAIHVEVISEITKFCDGLDLIIKGLDFSPIKGPAGNIEFLLYVMKGDNGSVLKRDNSMCDNTYIEKLVASAHGTLD